MRLALAAVACLALLLVGCGGNSPAPSTSPSTFIDLSSVKIPTPTPVAPTPKPTATPKPSRRPNASASPTPTPIDISPTVTPPATATVLPTLAPTPQPSQVAFATPAADCVDGWLAPTATSAEYAAALEMIEIQMGVEGPWTVDEMRYFTGPDVSWIIEPHYEVVKRWYVRASRTDEPTFRGRWLLEQRTDLIRGISGVAAYETTGYMSPDWTAFVGEGTPVIYTGLPGEWSGIPYDFVTGEGDSGNPGLPDEVIGCLTGT